MSTSQANSQNTPIRSRRAVLAGIASAAAALPIAAGTPTTAAATADPIYAAIERHKETEAAHLAAIKELCRFEKSGDCEHNWITEKPCHDEFEAFDALVGGAATTLAGVSAKVAYRDRRTSSYPRAECCGGQLEASGASPRATSLHRREARADRTRNRRRFGISRRTSGASIEAQIGEG
jgi:hypothetical protein